MTCAKECIDELGKLGVDASSDPYLEAVRFGCLHHLPPAVIVAGIWLAYRMFLLVNSLPDGNNLSPADKDEAVKLFREEKTVEEVFKALRPNATPKPKKP